METIFGQIFTHVANCDVAELTTLPDFIYLTQKDNPVSNTPEFMKIILTLESVIKISTHLIRISNFEEKKAIEKVEQYRKEVFGTGSKDPDLLSHMSSELQYGSQDSSDIETNSVPNSENSSRSDSSSDSSRTQSIFFKDSYGETVDERLNRIFSLHFINSCTTSLIVSKVDELFTVVEHDKRGDYVLYYNPLDSAYNVYYGTSCGTFFSFVRKEEYKDKPSLNLEHALLSGQHISFAGYVIYGCYTVLTLAILNGGVHQFTLDTNLGLFILTASNMQTPKIGNIYTITEQSSLKWNKVVCMYVEHKKMEEIWKNVAAAMSGMGYIVNPHQCNEKWRNLKKTYIKIRDTVGKTGSRRNNWEFYYEMEEALGESPNPPVNESGMANVLKECHPTEDNPDMTTSESYDLSSELSHLKDQTCMPASPPATSPSYSGEFNQESSLKRKMPPLEWYDEYLEELRAARRDRYKRHQDKQIFRQQLIDLCKQMLISSNNSIKKEIFNL